MDSSITRRGLSAKVGALAVTGALAGSARAQELVAQEAVAKGLDRLMTEGRYLPLWRETVGPPLKGYNSQWASFVGEEGVALGVGRAAAAAQPPGDDATALDAVAAIVEASRGRRVVMLNESHSASRHRLFLARVLRALRPEGFDILSAETFSNHAPGELPGVRSLKKGDPFPIGEGYYTCDPVFADAVREALDLGYRLEAHEQTSAQWNAKLKGPEAIAARETHQSEHLAAILAANPASRVLVYVGFSHLRKTPDFAGNRWLAARFLEKTGIDPLSVSQASSGSFGPHALDPAPTKGVLERFSPKAPIVVRAGGGVLGAEMAGADLAVFHPSLPDIDGRPGWLAADPVRKRLVVKTPGRAAGEVVIVQAMHAHEPDKAVPADQHVLAKDEARAVLFLRPGTYRVRIESDAGFATLKTVKV